MDRDVELIKKYKIKYAPEAMRDMAQMREYIGRELENPVSAQKVVDAAMVKCRSLWVFPRAGKVWGVVRGKELRTLRVKNFTVFYYIEMKTVVILRVLYAGRDAREVFGVRS